MKPVSENTGRLFHFLEGSRLMRACEFLSTLLLCLLVLTFASGCYVKRGLKTENWQDTSPPELSLEERGREAILEFPDGKVVLVLTTRTPEQQLTQATPLYQRPRTSSFFWVSDPRGVAGELVDMGNVELSGVDYLIAYWLGRYHGFLSPDE